MIYHTDLSHEQLAQAIRAGLIRFGGHLKFRIYGKLTCPSGKRMKRNNRVFFSTQQQARELGFRPCGHCMRATYQQYLKDHGSP